MMEDEQVTIKPTRLNLKPAYKQGKSQLEGLINCLQMITQDSYVICRWDGKFILSHVNKQGIIVQDYERRFRNRPIFKVVRSHYVLIFGTGQQQQKEIVSDYLYLWDTTSNKCQTVGRLKLDRQHSSVTQPLYFSNTNLICLYQLNTLQNSYCIHYYQICPDNALCSIGQYVYHCNYANQQDSVHKDHNGKTKGRKMKITKLNQQSSVALYNQLAYPTQTANCIRIDKVHVTANKIQLESIYFMHDLKAYGSTYRISDIWEIVDSQVIYIQMQISQLPNSINTKRQYLDFYLVINQKQSQPCPHFNDDGEGITQIDKLTKFNSKNAGRLMRSRITDSSYHKVQFTHALRTLQNNTKQLWINNTSSYSYKDKHPYACIYFVQLRNSHLFYQHQNQHQHEQQQPESIISVMQIPINQNPRKNVFYWPTFNTKYIFEYSIDYKHSHMALAYWQIPLSWLNHKAIPVFLVHSFFPYFDQDLLQMIVTLLDYPNPKSKFQLPSYQN